MHQFIKYQLKNILLIGLAILIGACGPQKAATKNTQSRNIVGGQHVQEQSINKSVVSSLAQVNLINSDQSIHPSLVDFMELFGLQHDGTTASVNEALQNNFLRKANQERCDLQDTPEEGEKKKVALQLLRQMGLVNEVDYIPGSVDCFLLFGAMTSTMIKRTQNFVEQCNKGMQCKNIVLLGGVRALREEEVKVLRGLNIDLQAFLKKVGKQEQDLTEADAFRAVWDMQVPEAIKRNFIEDKNLFFINSTDTTRGANNRPTTGATLDTWYDTCRPTPGHCHGNVEMPHGIRMEKVLRAFLLRKSKQISKSDKEFSITWNSPAASETLQMEVYKDELARTFYQECKLKGYI